MKKIPTIFARVLSSQPHLVTPVWTEGCEWVRDGEGVALRKWDGTCCLVRGGKLYKRRELRPGGHDRWHREAFEACGCTQLDGTYELIGPKINGGKDHATGDIHMLVSHDQSPMMLGVPRTFEGLKEYLATVAVEGIVFHHPDGRMAKIKRRDFGLKW